MNAMTDVAGFASYDVRTSLELDQLAKALLAAEAVFGSIAKSKPVQVRTKEGQSYSFKYADLDTILDAVKKPLLDNGILIIQMPCNSGTRTMLATRLLHSSGQWIESVVEVKAERPGAQGMGSAITYYRRYGISAALNIVADPDDDANAADGHHATPAQRRPAAPRQASQPREREPVSNDTAEAAAAINSAGMPWPLISRDGTAKACADRGAYVSEWRLRIGAVRKADKPPPEKHRTLADMQRVNADTFADLHARGDGATADEVARMMQQLAAELDKQIEGTFPGDRP